MNTKELAIERVLILAKAARMAFKFPHRCEMPGKDCMNYAIEQMDAAELPWSIQNNALCWYNDYDLPRADVLIGRNLSTIIKEIHY